jgi:outer membrane protein TolC
MFLFSTTAAAELSLQKAFDLALHSSGRGQIIDGGLEVAEQVYYAERINFYVPEISINGALPAYSENETYDFFPGTSDKGLRQGSNFDFDADITLKQNLFTGGNLTLKANLVNNDWDYQLLRDSVGFDSSRVNYLQNVKETHKLGTFRFTLMQPILKPSDAKNDLNNSRDDLALARLNRIDQVAQLKREVVEAFFGVLQTELTTDINRFRLESAHLRCRIDSTKLIDGLVSEEDWLSVQSDELDAELAMYEAENEFAQRRRDLAILLDWESSSPLSPQTPAKVVDLADGERGSYLNNWSESLPIQMSRLEHSKAKRAADYQASGHGLTGAINASYNMERGTVEDNRSGFGLEDDLKTDSWGVSLNFSYPLWDGGASSAAVTVARLAEEQAYLELRKAEKSAQYEIENLINQASLSYRKLDVLSRQIEIARTRLDIAQERLEDGQISRLTFFENQVSFLESKHSHLDELKSYYSVRVELEGKYLH